MGINKHLQRRAARRVLRSTAESNLHYMLGQRSIVTEELERLCLEAGWTYYSYFLAVLFMDWSLLEQVGAE